MRQRIGQMIDSLGVTADIHEGDLYPSVIVIMKVIGADGGSGIIMETSEGCGWLDQVGMMAVASEIIRTELPIRRPEG